MSDRATDERMMQLAVDAAEKGRATARPNPVVGAVVVRDGEVLGVGYHARAGGPHAERVAIENAGGDVRGATMYVTLEPCSHYGRTPPCADALIEAGVARVVAGTIDPNPKVSGRGLARLRDAGVATEVGVLEHKCWELNLDFVVAIRTGRPMVTAKLATSLDGKIATRTGDSQWISGELSRARVHEMRARAHAILVGSGTLRADDPRLTARPGGVLGGPQPHRYVVDRHLAVPLDAQVLDTSVAPSTVICAADAPAEREGALAERGVDVIRVGDQSGQLAVEEAFAHMSARGYISLMVEGGGALVGYLSDRGLVDRLALFIAPVLLGGREAIPSVGGFGAATVAEGQRASRTTVERLGDDVLVVADLSPHLVCPSIG